MAVNCTSSPAAVLSASGKLFHEADKTAAGDDVQFTAMEGGIYYGIITASGTAKVECIGGGRDEEVFGDLKKGSVLYLGYLETGQTVTLTNGDEKDETPKISADIYRLDQEVLEEILATLSEPYLEHVVWESDFISGEITLEEAGRLVLSVPYEEGWTVEINGLETEGALFGGCLMAFDLEPGTYKIQMRYRPAGSAAGIAVSIVCIMLFAGIMALQHKALRHKKRRIAIGKSATK